MKRAWIIGLCVSGAVGISHASEFTPGSRTAAIFGGIGGVGTQYSYQPGTDEPASGGGGAYGAQFLYYVKGTPAIGLGFDLTSSMNGTRTDDDLLSGGYNTDQRVKSLVGLAIARLSYPRGFFRPYIFGGLGFHNSSQLLTATPQAGVTWPNSPASGTRVLIDEHKTGFSLGFGIGSDLFITDNFFFGPELRIAWLGGLDTDDNAAIQHAGFTVRDKNGLAQTNLLFRAGWKF
jgi:hypothetical protein